MYSFFLIVFLSILFFAEGLPNDFQSTAKQINKIITNDDQAHNNKVIEAEFGSFNKPEYEPKYV